MASINTTAGNVDVSITKNPDGTITFSANNWPGASIGPNNETVPGHCGGLLDVTTIADSIKTNESRIADKQYFIKDALDQINDTTRNPPYDPSYIAMLKTQVGVAQNEIQVIKDSLDSWNSLDRQLTSLTDKVNAADTANAPSGEAQTNEEKNAAEAQGVTNEPGVPLAETTDPTVNRTPDFRQRELPDEDRSEAAASDNQDEWGDLDGAIKAAESREDPTDELGNRLNGPPDTRRVTPASAQWAGVKDTRVILRTPKSYFGKLTSGPGNEIQKNGGILFPYTPTISYDSQASYGNTNPLHSNYTQYFFKNSSISSISVSGKFTVQNEYDAKMWLSIVHLARLLTKMPFGADTYAGSAPPVCRLDGFGNYVLANVPVAVTSFKFDLPDGVDYINVSDGDFTNSMAPTISTLTFSLIPMYSRNEIRNFSVEKFRDGKLTGQGYL